MTPTSSLNASRRKAVWGPKCLLAAMPLVILALPLTAAASTSHHRQASHHKAPVVSPHRDKADTVKSGLPNSHAQKDDAQKLDTTLAKHAKSGSSKETVDLIVTLQKGQELPAGYKKYVKGKKLDIINGYELDKLPSSFLTALSKDVSVHRAHFNHAAKSLDLLSTSAVQADVLVKQFGYTGAGVGVAIIDSGFTSYPQPDLKDSRITKFVDFVNPSNQNRIDTNGHGTHVAGIIGGTGKLDSKETGFATGAQIISLRVLDEQGQGSIGNIIAAMDWVSKNYIKYNIRIVNMSVGAGVYESYWTDPLTLAAKALVDQGITVVTAAGNFGKNSEGELQWGGITSPGVAPWVLTVCAFSTNGTLDTSDDAVAGFSSSGPTYIDFTAKPDLCAPGVGVVSLAAPESALYTLGAVSSWLVDSVLHPTYPFVPYLSLTGTSQATPAVAGTVALMLQANPNLTPNLIKAILQYTSSSKPGVSPLRQGAGFMNTLGAVELAKFYAKAKPGAKLPIDDSWSQHIIWGNHMLSGGVLSPTGNAWQPGVEWGWAYTQGDDGDNIVWGTDCSDECDNIVWGTGDDGDNIVWGTGDDGDNIVWGTGDDGDNIVWGTGDDGDNIVWGTGDDDDNIVWGTDCGGDDCDNIVWGTSDDADNIVWGTGDDGDNIVWGTGDDGDNIVWGTGDDGDNIVWGTAAKENVVWSFYGKKGGK